MSRDARGYAHATLSAARARLESAEDNAATARLRADQMCYRIDLVEQTANEALRRATQALVQVQQLQQAKRK
ncbi:MULTISPECIES: hypothetical protein [Pseudomonas]|uniref:hypothetical protein n=1 Tax=Pseudomonas TaxID=286 RepID=UPI00224AB178|nr:MULTISPECIES: hypothetical protein [unclassified Pseudomonas]MCX2888423.1 hypothetical protein [Pseudomonas sp. DCB_BI]MDH4549344.1 hypothetical protein [Pseudomonas sp. BN607]